LRDVLGSKVAAIKESDRLVESPAIIMEHEAGAFRRMIRYVDPQRTPELTKQKLEINPKHEIILQLNEIRTSKPNLAKIIADQIYDDALIAAGLLDDSRPMLPRLNRLMSTALRSHEDVEPFEEKTTAPAEKSTTKETKKEEKKSAPKEKVASKEKASPKEKVAPKKEAAKEESPMEAS